MSSTNDVMTICCVLFKGVSRRGKGIFHFIPCPSPPAYGKPSDDCRLSHPLLLARTAQVERRNLCEGKCLIMVVSGIGLLMIRLFWKASKSGKKKRKTHSLAGYVFLLSRRERGDFAVPHFWLISMLMKFNFQGMIRIMKEWGYKTPTRSAARATAWRNRP